MEAAPRARNGDEAQLRVRLVARVILQGGGQAVGIGDAPLRGADRVLAGLWPDMREVTQDTEPVHLDQHIAAEIGQPAVARLVAA